MKNSTLVIASSVLTLFIVYTLWFFYTFFNLQSEFVYNFRSLENLNFHEKYSKKIHHLREEFVLDWLWKKPKAEDLMFTTINDIEDKELIVLVQGDSYMEQLTFSSGSINFSAKLVQKFKSKKKIGFINGGTGSYAPSVMNLQLDVLEEDFNILPNIVIAYVDQSDLGDENCRYKNNKVYENGVLKAIQPESHLMWRDAFNYSEIYGKSKISLKYKSKILQTFHLINFKVKYGLTKSGIRFYRKYISNSQINKEKLNKCYWNETQDYLINPNNKATEYFADQVKAYLKNMEQKKHIEKIFFVTFPHKKNFNKTYKLDVSDVIKNIVKDKKNITHINFSEILLNDKNFDYENVWLEDQIHLNGKNHANIFIKKILEELSKYLL